LAADFPEASFLRHRPEQIAWQARAIERSGGVDPVIAVQPRSARGGSSEVFVRAPDRDGLFAAIAATLDRLGLDVLGARLLASGRGRVFDTFEVLDAATSAALDAGRARELEAALARVLSGDRLEARVARRTLPRRLRHFQRVPQIEFGAVGAATQLALVCSDRPGLLAEVAQALRDARVRVHDARIATFGERVEDFFVLTDENDRSLDGAAQSRLRGLLLDRLGEVEATG
jgi:[protein-PII] uridylyltransferase